MHTTRFCSGWCGYAGYDGYFPMKPICQNDTIFHSSTLQMATNLQVPSLNVRLDSRLVPRTGIHPGIGRL